jgi:hypothetical protein
LCVGLVFLLLRTGSLVEVVSAAEVSTGVWRELEGASLRRSATIYVPRPDFKGVGHPLPWLHQAVQAILSPLFPKWLGSPVEEWWPVRGDLVGGLPESSTP